MNLVVHQIFWLARIILSPVTATIVIPIRLIQLAFNSGVLFTAKHRDFFHLSGHRSINDLFYWVLDLNIKRHTWFGRSPTTGDGDQPISRWFTYTRPSLYLYRNYGTHLLVFGMAIWLLSHSLWLQSTTPATFFIILILTACSTSFYYSLYSQNYNLAGWLFLPIAIWGMHEDLWLLTSAAWLAISFFSTTAAFICGIFSISSAIFLFDIDPILAFIPAGIKCATHFIPGIVTGTFTKDITNITKMRGVIKGRNKYTRTKFSPLNKYSIYLAIVYFQFALVVFFETGSIPYLYLTGIIIFIINTACFRFMDKESVIIIMLSLGTAQVFLNPTIFTIISFWLSVSIPASLIVFAGNPSSDIPPKTQPFKIKPILNKMDNFLSCIPSGERVVALIPPPAHNFYENIFNGWRLYIETPSYICNLRDIHYMPDWWSINDNNHIDGKNLWAVTPDDAHSLLQTFPAKYALLYIHDDGSLDSTILKKWTESNFEFIGDFSWQEIKKEHFHSNFYAPTMPRIILVRNDLFIENTAGENNE